MEQEIRSDTDLRYEIVEEVRGKRPLIHCITNYVDRKSVV